MSFAMDAIVAANPRRDVMIEAEIIVWESGEEKYAGWLVVYERAGRSKHRRCAFVPCGKEPRVTWDQPCTNK